LTLAAVIIPVKSSGMKSRLSGVLSQTQRLEFAELLLADVLSAIKKARLMDRCLVVSPDRGMLAIATQMGAGTVPEPKDSGVNSAVERGMREVGKEGDVLVVPSDLPLLRGSDVRGLLSMKSGGREVVITPSETFNGTNALLFSLSAPLPLSYDADSFWNHLRAAARLNLSVGVCTEKGVMFDVDSPRDLWKLARSRSGRASAAFAREARI
jgi:2-phospho-L-lactate guanylyltransferase